MRKSVSLFIITLIFILISCEKKEEKKIEKKKPAPIVQIQEKIHSVIEKNKPSLITIFSFSKNELKPLENESLGSGFVIKKDKDYIYILTNYHVIEKSKKIKVKFFNNIEKEAEVVGYDDKSDIAVLKVKVNKDLNNVKPVKIGDISKLKEGYFVLSAGSPYNLGHTFTFGIISALHRNLGLSPYEDYIQTDAAINPGNSGGPLFDINGKVVGMNIAIVDTGQGIGFAIPINTVLDIYNEILKYGKVRRGWLGVLVQPISNKAKKRLNIKNGVVVIKVFKNSPAEKYGLEVGDIILSINGKPVKSPQQLSFFIQRLKINSQIKITVLRDKKQLTLPIKIEEQIKTDKES